MTTFYSILRQLPPILCATLCLPALLLAGCSQYQLNINNRIVYDPLEFRQSIRFADTALEVCVKHVLTEMNITSASQLRRLQCGPGHIQSLEGLEIFIHLEQFAAAENNISNITALKKIAGLTHLNLSGNNIIDASSLSAHAKLRLVNIEGNVNLKCETLSQLNQQAELELNAPEHCSARSR
ncbi:hypothetical protein [Teredinibacter purpureus]|uniref:hypothetical protein n=1 Tax=Teredinibacter purpureus TaxID=2731756 RepID=UPI0006966E37|nr:hypothetical protein [Teredinibacter purpureus]